MSFFFSKQAAKKFQDVDLLHQMGCKLCPYYNLPLKNKDIKPSGAHYPEILILGLGPGKEETAKNEFFVGNSGRYLKEHFTAEQWLKIRINNVVRTQPPDNAPVFEAIEACRPSVEQDIALAKPKIILGLGDYALNWVHKSKANISAWRGHPFPVKILDHTCWFYPVNHPSAILQAEQNRAKMDSVFKFDIKNLYRFLHRNLLPYVVPKSEIFTNIHILNTVADIKAGLLRLYKEPHTVTDLETTSLGVYANNAKIYSFAIGTKDYTISFAWQHPQATWTPAELAELKKLLYWFYKNKRQRKTAHNAGFEIEWLVWLFDDPEITYSNWHDSMSSSYVLGYGGNSKESEDGSEKLYKGLLSLDSLVKVCFGFDLKIASNLDRSNLGREDLQKVLLYGGGDTKWDFAIAEKLDADVEFEGLRAIVDEHDRRIPAVALMRRQGLVYSIDRVNHHANELEEKLTKVHNEVLAHPKVIEYISKFSKFNIQAPVDVANLLEYLKFNVYYTDKEGKKKKSSDDGILKAIDHPIARGVLEYRELHGIKTKYVDIFIPNKKNYVVWPDNLIHSNFTTHFTTTGRLSSSNPNLQNFPKHKQNEIRDIIVAPPGYVYTSCDYGQIEYRCLVMVSKDKKLIEYVWNDRDIHSEWALKIATKYPKRVGIDLLNKWKKVNITTLKKEDKLFEAFRYIVKNNFVFAAFYGAGVKKLAAGMNMPEEVVRELYDEFWEEFAGVHAWHKSIYEFYAKHGYVETLTGRRRYAPIDSGEQINTPIQGFAADIMLDALNRLVEYALETGQLWAIPCNSIHDDLGHYQPIASWQKNLDKVIEIMLDCRYPWINVPLSIEASSGPDFYNQKKYGEFNNAKELKARLAA